MVLLAEDDFPEDLHSARVAIARSEPLRELII
jgi:hypothetical protein